jgi:hypothetical protein
MLRSITWVQFKEWIIYSELEPFDELRADYRTAQIVQTFINMNRDTKKYPNPISIDECLLPFGDVEIVKSKKNKQTWQEQKMIAMMYVASAKKKE